MRAQPKPRGRWRSEAYLRFVREHPCCVCGAEAGTEAHHWQPYASGMGRKPDDTKAAPVCSRDHRHWHDRGHFPGMTREESERLMLEAQVRCLAAWLTREQGAA